MKKRYRVKVVVDNHDSSNTLKAPETKYVIQEKWGPLWMNENSPTTNKEWAYRTCAEMNTPYKDMGGILLRLPDANEAEWVAGCAMEAVEKVFDKDSVRYNEMRKHYEDLMKQIKRQK